MPSQNPHQTNEEKNMKGGENGWGTSSQEEGGKR
jgi:hypothetical protein